MLALRRYLNQPVDAASVAVFRMMFGWLMALEVMRYVRFGFVKKQFIDPSFHFTFMGFDWVRPHGAWFIYALYALLAVCALGIAWGYFYRLCAWVFTAGFAYVFLLDAPCYLNHYYVIALVAFALSVIPAATIWSTDAERREPIVQETMPRWCLLLLRTQLLIVYVYGGIAKINADWFRGQPLRMWLSPLADTPIVGGIFEYEFTFLALSWGGFFLDACVAPLLLFRRTRTVALVSLGCFHVCNALIFSIGIFPPMMLAANLLFLEPDWPRKLSALLKKRLRLESLERKTTGLERAKSAPLHQGTLLLLTSFLLVQLLLPFRHHLYPGDVAWTEEGHRFSWRMKLRQKSGDVKFFIQKSGDADKKQVSIFDSLTPKQVKKMTCHPDMILQYAHRLGEHHRSEDGTLPQVFASARCSLNGGPVGALIDESVNLVAQPRSIYPYHWVLPRPPG